MKSVQLTIEEWQSVLAGMEVGIKAIGFAAFVPGGELMAKIKEQVEDAQASQQSEQVGQAQSSN